jgi:hypothetical protein
MDFPIEIWNKILFEFTKNNMERTKEIPLVSKDLNLLVKENIKPEWENIMSCVVNMRICIAYFVDRKDEDSIDYLIGEMEISNFKKEDIESILPKPKYELDKMGSNRLLDNVILSNIEMGKTIGPRIYGIDKCYEDSIVYYHDIAETSVSTQLFGARENILTDIEFKTNKYWLYIFIENCNYCHTFSYMLLPYLDNSIKKSPKGSELIKIYEVPVNSTITIEDLY